MNFTKYNKNQFEKIEWSKKTDGFSFKKIKDLYEEGVKRVQVFGFFFTKSENYGLQPNAILNDCILNLPTHQKDTISEMLKDKECVKAINNGECSLEFREYQSKYNKTCYEISFVDTPTLAETINSMHTSKEENADTQPSIF